MLKKTEKNQYLFEANIRRFEGTSGIVSSGSVEAHIMVATPPDFAGGVAGLWSPEQLFLSALTSCMMATYLAIAGKRNLGVAGFECNAIGLVQLVEGHLEFTSIELFPKIFVEKPEDITLANEVLQKAYKHCIIANSIKTKLVHHGEVLLDKALTG
jgi:organic hydroperoxide reductase OsmC/OhrA